MATDHPNRQHRQVGQYYLMEKIAQGGMAEIFKGLSYDVHGLKKTVCIKKILPHIAASQEFIDSLIDEAKIAVNLVHGNIAQTYDLGKVGDDYFMVMEYVDGKSLSQIHKRCLARSSLIPQKYLIYFISEVLNGLYYIHRRTDDKGNPLHIVHRDMSPQNIMVSYSGTVKIIDFGIAKSGFKAGSTDSGILKGKFAYMSPEQAYGDSIDNRSDIFSAGIMLHEMLTGKRLFKADDSRETIRNVRRAKVESPSAIQPGIPEELDRIAMKALTKDRRFRYGQASEMHDDLIKFLYANHPEFKPSEAASFVQELFKDELENPRKMEADTKTPYLIIDRSNSALVDDSQFEITGAAKAPVDLKEYMLDDTGTSPGENEGEEVLPEEEEPAVEEVKPKARKPRISPMEILSIPRIRTSLTILLAAILIGIAAFIIHMKREAAPDKTSLAEIMVVTDPIDAEVLLDGKVEGSGSPLSIRNISPGDEHTLTTRKDGYVPHERRMQLNPGEFLSISVILTPAAPPTAAIEVVTTPPGATVFIDDRETSHRTPAILKGLDPKVEHTVGLFLRGYRFWSKAVDLKPGETKSYDVQLTRDFGSLYIETEPSDALVMLDDVPIGQTPLTREKLDPDKIYRVEIWLKGYQSAIREVKVNAGQKKELRLTLTKEPTEAEIEEMRRKEAKER